MHAWRPGFTTRSDFARENAEYVAMAALSGFITTEVLKGVFGRTWSVTSKGLEVIEEAYGIPSNLLVASDHDD